MLRQLAKPSTAQHWSQLTVWKKQLLYSSMLEIWYKIYLCNCDLIVELRRYLIIKVTKNTYYLQVSYNGAYYWGVYYLGEVLNEENNCLKQYLVDLVSKCVSKFTKYLFQTYFFEGLVSTGTPKAYQWFDGKPVSYAMPWCSNQPADTMKDVVMLSR